MANVATNKRNLMNPDELLKMDHNKEIIDAISRKFNTVVLLNSKDMGESPLINTYIINEIFTKNDIRFIDIEQRVDTNLDGSIISYENPEYIMFMDLLEKEEKRLRSEKIKQGRKFKEKIKK